MAVPCAPSPRPLDIPDEAWAEAVRRAALIRPLAETARNSCAAIRVAAGELGLSVAQVYRLIGAYRARPVARSLVATPPGPKRGKRLLPPEVEQKIEAQIRAGYKRRERPTVRKLMRDIRADCRAASLPVPSRKAVQARLAACSPKELARAREGADAARQRFAPVRPGLRPAAPLALVQIDHTLSDVQLVDEAARLVLGRPWLTLLLDVSSRCVLGLHLSFDAPSSASVALAVAQGVLPKEGWLASRGLGLAWPMHGLPQVLHSDNGREFHAKALKRGCEQHGIRLQYRPPATPRFGGHIERLMGTLMGRIHALPGTTFSGVAQRGDYPSEQRAVLTLREFERVLVLEVLGPYHNEVHSALGTTPAAAWAKGAASSATPPRFPSDPTALVLDFLPFEERVVRREGVRLFNVTYYDGALATLLDAADRRCRVKYDPRDMGAVFVELPDGDGHLRVPCADLGRPPVSLWEQRAAARRLREAGQASVDERAVLAAVEEQRRVLEAAQASSKAARRAVARMPGQPPPAPDLFHRQSAAGARQPTGQVAAMPDEEDDARVPVLAEQDAWRIEFLR